MSGHNSGATDEEWAGWDLPDLETASALARAAHMPWDHQSLAERNAIVVWLRDVAAASCYEHGADEVGSALTYAALCVERGDHLKDKSE